MQALLWGLHHKYHEHVVSRIDPEGRAARAAPGPFPRLADRCRAAARRPHRDAQAKAGAGARQVVGTRMNLGPQMIRRHVGDGLRSENALAVERAPVEEHLQQTCVISRGGDHAAAAELAGSNLGRIADRSVDAERPVVSERLRDAALLRGVRDVKTCVAHFQRIENALLLELVERFAGNDLDEAAEHVNRVAVVPGRAGLIGERQLGEAVHEVGVGELAAHQIDPLVGLLDERIAEETVGDSRRNAASGPAP